MGEPARKLKPVSADKTLPSKEHLYSITNTAVDAVFSTNDKMDINFVNPAAERMFKYDQGELLGENVTVLMPERYRAPHRAGVKRVLTTGKKRAIGKTLELVGVTKSGKEFPIELSLATWETDHKRYFTGIIRDRTKQKEMLDALEKSEQWSRNIINITEKGIWVLNENKVTTFANPQMTRMIGFEQKEMIGKPLFDFMDANAKNEALAYFERQTQGIVEKFDFRFRHKDGSDLWAIVSVTPMTDSEDKLIGSLGLVTDITDRKKAEKAIVEGQLAYQSLLNTSPDSIITTDTNGTVTFCNEEAANLRGYEEPGDMIGVNVFSLVAPEGRDSVQNNAGKEMKNAEVTLLRKNRTSFRAELSTSSILDSTGNPSGMIRAARDITTRKQIETALTESEKQFRLLVETSDDCICKIDLEGNFLYMSPAGLAAHNLSA